MKLLQIIAAYTIGQILSLNTCLSVPTHRITVPQKDWNIMVYMANNNNLHRFGVQNFRQMVKVGSSPYMNILLQMDHFGELAVSRFYIEKNNPNLLESHANTATSFSGTRANLIDFAHWGLSNFASNQQCLVLWNHGAGIKDINAWGRYLVHNRDSLFVFNNDTGLLELDRSMRASRHNAEHHKHKGIAFNDAAEEYLNNQDLKSGLEEIVAQQLGNKKIEIISMDACHMAMVEVASQIKTSAKILVASQEVEPGSGINYIPTLSQFADKTMDSTTFAKHIVQSYRNEYEGTLGDYTQSAVDLSYTDALEKNIDSLAKALINTLSNKKASFVQQLLQLRTGRVTTTEFYDDDYIDLGHLYKSLISLNPTVFKDICTEGLLILNKMVIDNVAGRNLLNASGLSIYFPKRSIHTSYAKTVFAQTTAWPQFLDLFIKMTRIKPQKPSFFPAFLPTSTTSQRVQRASVPHVKNRKTHGAKDDHHDDKDGACCGDCARITKESGKKFTCCPK